MNIENEIPEMDFDISAEQFHTEPEANIKVWTRRLYK